MSRSHLVSTLIALVFLLAGGFERVAKAQEPDGAPNASAPASQPAPPLPDVVRPGRVLDAKESCPVVLPDWATPPEHYAWSRICLGLEVDMSRYKHADGTTAPPGGVLETGDGFGCEARHKVQDWPADRVLTGRFIRLVTTRAPYNARAARPSVFIRCAVIEGDIDLSLETVPVMLRLENNRFLGDIYFADTSFAKDVSLDGSDLGGRNIFAEGLRVGDDLFIRKTRVGQIVLLGARIEGNLELSGSLVGILDIPGTTIYPAGLKASLMSVGGTLLATEGAYLQDVDLLSASVGKSVNLDGAIVRDMLNLNGIKIGEALFLRDGMTTSQIDLVAAEVGTGIEANDIKVAKPSAEVLASGRPVDRLTGSIQAGRLQVDGSVFFNRAQIAGDLLLSSATVRGPIEMSGINVAGSFEALETQVTGRVSPIKGARLNKVDLRGASIAGGLQLFGGRFDGYMDLRNATFGVLELWADQRSEAQPAAPAPKGTPVEGKSLEADAAILAQDGADKAPAPDDEAAPEATLVPQDAAVTEKVVPDKDPEPDPEKAETSGAAVNRMEEMNVAWGPQASLDLRNADIGVLQAKFMQSWQLDDATNRSREPVPLPVRLENLRYDRLVVAPTDAAKGASELDARPLIDWINRAVDAAHRQGPEPPQAKDNPQAKDKPSAANAGGLGGAAEKAAIVQPSFVPQPFRQLEETLRNMGATSQADDVLVAGHTAAIASLPAGPEGWPQTLSYGIWWALVGFGAHPFRVLWWFAALVAVGVFVARLHGPLCRRGWTDCFWYSLENALPIVQPSRDHQKVVHDDPRLRNFFHFQKVAGFVLATILVGALTLLGG